MPREMITMETESLKQLESDVKTFLARAYPFAAKQTINKAAFTAQKMIRREIKSKFIIRNRFTINSIQVVPTRSLDVDAQESIVGSIAPYMDEQEFGGIKTKTGKEGVSIPTTVASGEGRSAGTRKKKVPRGRLMGAITLRNNRVKATNRRQENAIKVTQAIALKKKFVFLNTERHPGIYRITGGKKNPKIDLMYDMSKKTVPIPRNPTFGPVTDRVAKLMPFFYEDALNFQVKRHGLFKSR